MLIYKNGIRNYLEGNAQAFADNIQQIKDSKYLATICLDVPGTVLDAEALKVETPDYAKLAELFGELEFRKMRDEVRAKIGNDSLFAEQSAPVTSSSPATGSSVSVGQSASSSQPSLAEGRDTGNRSSQPIPEGVPVAPQSYQTIRDIKTNYIIVDTPEKRQDMVSELFWTAEWAFDTETTALNIIDAELVGISFAAADHKAWYVPVPADQNAAKAIVEELRPIFENEAALKIAQNAKYDYSILKRYGVEVAYPLFDTMIAHYLLEPEQPHNMDYLSEIYLGYKPIPTSALIDTGKKKKAAEADLDLFAMMDAAEDEEKPKTMRDCPVAQVAE